MEQISEAELTFDSDFKKRRRKNKVNAVRHQIFTFILWQVGRHAAGITAKFYKVDECCRL